MAPIPWKNKREQHEPQFLAPLADLRHEMQRAFGSLREDPFRWLSSTWGQAGAWVPAVDVAETDDEVVIRAEVPGVDPDDLDITVTGDTLTLAGEKKDTTEKRGTDFHHIETRYGSFRRTVGLPEGVVTTDTDAEFHNGVLTVRLKKSAAAAAKRIHVKGGGQPPQ